MANLIVQPPFTKSSELAGIISDETGSGALVFATTPTLITPVIGAATGTSLDLGATTLYASRAITVDTGGVLNIDIGSAAGDDFTVDTSKLVVEGDTGNVGIGTTSPSGQLHVVGDDTSAVYYLDTYDDTGNSQQLFRRAQGTVALPTQVLTGNTLGTIGFRGYHSGGAFSTSSRAGLFVYAAEDWTATAQGTYMRFSTTAIGGTSTTTKIHIGDTSVGIGTTAPYSLLDVSSTTGGILTLSRADTSVTAADLIGQIDFHTTDTQTTTNPIAAEIKVSAANTIATDINPGIMDFLVTGTAVAGALIECMSFQATTVPQISFFGGTPATQPAHIADPTGGVVVDIEARAALVSINALLATLGLSASS